MQLTLLDDDEAFSLLLELLVPFSISQRLPSVGLPRAARAPRNRSRRRLKSGNEKDDRLRRMLLGTFHFADCNFVAKTLSNIHHSRPLLLFLWLFCNAKTLSNGVMFGLPWLLSSATRLILLNLFVQKASSNLLFPRWTKLTPADADWLSRDNIFCANQVEKVLVSLKRSVPDQCIRPWTMLGFSCWTFNLARFVSRSNYVYATG